MSVRFWEDRRLALSVCIWVAAAEGEGGRSRPVQDVQHRTCKRQPFAGTRRLGRANPMGSWPLLRLPLYWRDDDEV